MTCHVYGRTGVPLFRGTFFWKIWNYWYRTRDKKEFGIIICMNLKQCDESSILIN